MVTDTRSGVWVGPDCTCSECTHLGRQTHGQPLVQVDAFGIPVVRRAIHDERMRQEEIVLSDFVDWMNIQGESPLNLARRNLERESGRGAEAIAKQATPDHPATVNFFHATP